MQTRPGWFGFAVVIVVLAAAAGAVAWFRWGPTAGSVVAGNVALPAPPREPEPAAPARPPGMVVGHGAPPPVIRRRTATRPVIRRGVAPPPDEFAGIDGILKHMPLGNAAFTAPRSMNVHGTAVIDLVLGVTTGMDELQQMLGAEGVKYGARVKVSDRMQARLTGPDFAITAITPETQAVADDAVTEWKWEIEPTRTGRHDLHLTLSALVDIDGASTPRAIRTFDDAIQVDITWPQRLEAFASTNWQWLWAVVLVPVAGWAWRRRRRTPGDGPPGA